MTGSLRSTAADRRVRDGLLAALVPVVACLTALVGLTAWTRVGAAGTPARVEVGVGRVFLPYAGKERTAAFFAITNTGGADDQLVSVTSPALQDVMLSRHEPGGDGADTMGMAPTVNIPAGSRLTMTPGTVDVMATVKGRWKEGDAVPFVLHFRHSGAVDAVAFVVRPGS
ncbi:copper chaperone PCu(A)C [Streptomyces sp. WAC06614]|uniref:copper chaperone PCu(A)C n=1 Tax=Streptomyces sp. WAC06614 TaxID=2487416 RepID=UPI000F7B5CF2|nr:copper chaperone PCu(A)C [Streptomyces sp. WAC06614]RSS78938.1 copper chaperone PCu(A)C [Streptomyces sp. WAC06614]